MGYVIILGVRDLRGSPGGGLLVLAATPIGDIRDAPSRLVDEIRAADVVAAEDTRRLRRLIRALGLEPADVPARAVSYFDGNEEQRTPELVTAMVDGARVLLLSDAGMPSVSDPGFRLVSAAIDAGVRVTVVPGPSAVLAALAVSGLPVDRFCFEGFLPRKSGERVARLRELATEPRTLVFFEAPHRLAATLAELTATFGVDRRAVVCRELTKTYEEIRRGSLGELVAWATTGVRGEITLVVAGAPNALSESYDDAELAARVGVLEQGGTHRKAAIAAVAAETGAPRRRVFDAVVAAKHGPAEQ